MPITFEPMADTSAAQAYGASLARREDRDFAQRSSQAAAEIGLRSSALAQADEHFQAQLADQRGQAIFHEGNKFALQESSQNHQEYMARLQAELNNTQLNQAEDIRRQRLERQVEYIQANSGEGRPYSAEDGRNMITQLRTGLDPLQERLRRSQQTHVELQNVQLMDANARAHTTQAMNDRFAAQTLPDATVRHYDDDGSLVAISRPDGHGGFHDITVSSAGRNASGPRPMSENQLASLSMRISRDIHNDPAWMSKPPSEQDAEILRRFNQERQRAQGSGGQEALMPARPITLPDDAPLSRLPADQRGVLRGLNADSAALLDSPNSRLTNDEKTEVRTDISRFRALYRQYGLVAAMPPTERSEFLAIARRLDELTGRHRGPGRPAPETSPAPQRQQDDVASAIGGMS